jgi:hypothetical protein
MTTYLLVERRGDEATIGGNDLATDECLDWPGSR